MQGLSALHEDVVGHIDDVGDGPDAHGMQTVAQGCGAGADLDSRQHAAAVAGAELRVGNLDGGMRDVEL